MFCLKFYTFFKKFWYWIWFYYASYIQVISLLYHDAMIVWLWRLWLYRTTMILSDYDSIIVYDQFRQKKIVGIWSTNCLLEFWNWHLSFRKKQQDKRKSINQILFSTESTMLNLMMKSDLMTSRGATIVFCFRQLPLKFVHELVHSTRPLCQKSSLTPDCEVKST